MEALQEKINAQGAGVQWAVTGLLMLVFIRMKLYLLAVTVPILFVWHFTSLLAKTTGACAKVSL